MLSGRAQSGRGKRTRARPAWLTAELAALPPQSLVFAGGQRLRARRRPQAAGRRRGRCTCCGAATSTSPAKPAVAGHAELRRGTAGAVRRLARAPDESARRAALARWIIDPRNPLTWRSIVNRVWQYHFGRGLVATPNDFGRMGASSLASGAARLAGRDVPRFGRLAQAAPPADRDERRLPAEQPRPIPSVRGHGRRQPAGSGGRIGAGSMPNRFTTRSSRSPAGSTDDGRAFGPAVHARARASTSRRWSTTRSTTGTARARAAAASTASSSAPCPTRSSTPSTPPTPRSSRRCATSRPRRSRHSCLLNNPFVLRQCEHLAGRLERARARRLDDADPRRFRAGLRPPARVRRAVAAGRAMRARHGLANLCRLIINSNEFLFVN